MLGDIFQLSGGRVVEINIGVCSRAPVLLEGDELLVVGYVTNVQAGFVLADQSGLEVDNGHLEDVKETRIALIGGQEKRLAIVTPAEEVGLHLIAGRQVSLRAICLSH